MDSSKRRNKAEVKKRFTEIRSEAINVLDMFSNLSDRELGISLKRIEAIAKRGWSYNLPLLKETPDET